MPILSVKNRAQFKMTAITARFNRFFLLSIAQMVLIPGALGQIPQLSPPQLQWLGERIFQNECNAQFECLTSWNAGEDFPSLGIGHFIWYRQAQQERFEETFPSLLKHYQDAQYSLPDWLQQLHTPDSPWQSREQFLAEQNSPNMLELRQFLANTVDLQVDFIQQRLHTSLPTILTPLENRQRKAVETSFYQLASSHPPYGMYAVIDYVHFKGTGTASSERYQGEGWGLLQVLLEMQTLKQPNSPASLANFIDAATTVLERRVANAPPERGEQRWLQGWKNRLLSYLPPD